MEIGIDISTARSKSADEFREAPVDLVVTVRDDAAENCPFWHGQGKRAHLDFPDPSKATGVHKQVIPTIRTVRDEIQERVISFLDSSATKTR
jgi:arsenate reductase (thioredoxin)